jgi:hypothetical protein
MGKGLVQASRTDERLILALGMYLFLILRCYSRFIFALRLPWAFQFTQKFEYRPFALFGWG